MGVESYDQIADKIEDETFGIQQILKGEPRIAFLSNVKTISINDDDDKERSAIICYFYDEEGEWFRSVVKPYPYFYARVANYEWTPEVINHLWKLFENKAVKIEVVEKTDLDDVSHMAGDKNQFIRLSFRTTSDLVSVRKDIQSKMCKDDFRKNKIDFNHNNLLGCIVELREYDVLYHTRTMIDMNFRVGNWYKIEFGEDCIERFTLVEEEKERPDFIILAYDIETTKLELKFPDATYDQIMLISYVVNGDGYLITNREIISEDIEDFEYIPNEEFETDITVFNEPNERALLIKFIEHIKQIKPFIITTFNGDFFDWPFVETRLKVHGIDMHDQIGIKNTKRPSSMTFKDKRITNTGEYFGRFIVHLDCFPWVKRDSYLPQGSQGLKSVTKEKLHYEPIEVDPELMVTFAKERPKILCNYSVSDAVATYYLYRKHIHDFIFALCTIIPLGPDDVLRRGSGTLCENLLMAEAFRLNIIFPNKISVSPERFYNGHFIDSETYIGGKVECLHNGIYRSDLETDFEVDQQSYRTLAENVEKVVEFCVRVEQGRSLDELANLEEVRGQIKEALNQFGYADKKKFKSTPLIYHIDVAAMYPNIILTNRLQPVAIVDQQTCASCVFNAPESNCKREMEWKWKGDYFPLSRAEYEKLKIMMERTSPKFDYEQLKVSVKNFCKKVYKKPKASSEELRRDTVCMRENPFYVNTVRAFRDRRYDFKRLVKKSLGQFKAANAKGNSEAAKTAWSMVQLYESLQLAHKIILNSFYGYVMRRGSRWYSMEMAAMVTYTGAEIIKKARDLLVSVGKPLELDTDGVWTLLPRGFPENFELKFKDGSKDTLSYPCSVCNLLIYDLFKNTQYQTEKTDKFLQFDTREEMTIFFEIDGPYKAMIIPASKEKGKTLKKRYIVFDLKDKLAEVKGFEIKRRGELKIIKIFQKEIFSRFLAGSTLEECYTACAETARKWLDILINKGAGMYDEDIIDLIGESKTLSKSISEYGAQKGVALTAAKRMKEFLGANITSGGSSLTCKFIIAKEPKNAPVNERAIPISIFKFPEEAIKMKFIKKWTKDHTLLSADLKEILDWDYYKERLGNTVQKMLTLTAAYQKIDNPIPELPHPKWLLEEIRTRSDTAKTSLISTYFGAKVKETPQKVPVIVDIFSASARKSPKKISLGKSSLGKDNQENLNLGPCTATIQGNFHEWMDQQRTRWALRRKNRKAGQNYSSFLDNRKKDMSFFLHDSQTNLKKQIWNILGTQPTHNKGVYNVWIRVEGAVFATQINIPREVLMNTTESIPSFKEIKRKLPRDKKVHHLYQILMEESKFQRSKLQLERYMVNPAYEGIYQTQVDPMFTFFSQVGNHCILDKTAELDNQGCWNFQDVLSVSEPLRDLEQDAKFIYCGIISYQNNYMALVINQRSKSIDLLIVQKTRSVHIGEFKTLIKNRLSPKVQEFQIYSILVHQGDSLKGLIELVSSKYRTESQENYIITIQSNKTINNHALFKDYLSIFIDPLSMGTAQLNSIDWQPRSLEILCANYLSFGESLSSRISLSTDLDIPIGALPSEWITTAIDYLYARAISSRGVVSWASPNNHPDTGMGQAGYDESAYKVEDNMQPRFTRSGVTFCGNIAAEIAMNSFEFNLIFYHDEFQKLDGEYTRVLNKAEYMGSEAPITAFEIFTDVVKKTISRVQYNRNSQNVAILENFSKWICDPASMFFDPYLMALYNKLLQRSFDKLVDLIRSFGANIIDISPSKILLDTGKKTVSSAREYVSFLLESIRSTSYFSLLKFGDRGRFYQGMVYKDSNNYAGYLPDIQEIEIFWKESECLPRALQRNLIAFVNSFVRLHITATDKALSDRPDILEQNEVALLQVSQAVEKIIKDDFRESIISECLDFLVEAKEQLRKIDAFKELNGISNQDLLLQQTSKQADNFGGDGEEEEDYDDHDSFVDDDADSEVADKKQLDWQAGGVEAEEDILEIARDYISSRIPGERYPDKPSLGLMLDIICEIFYAVPFLYEETQFLTQMGSNILNYHQGRINHKCDALITIRLDGILCNDCCSITAIDLFRDFDSDSGDWICQCNAALDSQYVEHKIIHWLNQHIAYSSYQDLYCINCKLARIDQMSHLCTECGGKYQTRNNIPSFESFQIEAKNNFSNLMMIAEQCRLRELEVNLESNLSGIFAWNNLLLIKININLFFELQSIEENRSSYMHGNPRHSMLRISAMVIKK